jgi:ATP-dependent Clp protease protease subunit
MKNSQEFRKYAIKHHGISSSVYDQYSSITAQQQNNQVYGMTRSVIEERPTNFREIDVFSRLMMDRIIFLGLPIDDVLANVIVAQMLFLESVDAQKDILLYINSPGGSVYAGLGIYDTMQYIRPDVSTICTGLAASMGALLLTAGEKGKRVALPHSRVMIHQPLGGAGGQASDVQISAQQIGILKKELSEIIVKHTGQDFDTVTKDSDRNYWLRAQQAKEYGLIDEVLERKKED